MRHNVTALFVVLLSLVAFVLAGDVTTTSMTTTTTITRTVSRVVATSLVTGTAPDNSTATSYSKPALSTTLYESASSSSTAVAPVFTGGASLQEAAPAFALIAGGIAAIFAL